MNYMTTTDISTLLGCNRCTVHSWIKTKRLKSTRQGKCHMIAESSFLTLFKKDPKLQLWFRRNEQKPPRKLERMHKQMELYCDSLGKDTQYPIEFVGALFNLSPDTVRYFVRENKLMAYRTGVHEYISRKELIRFCGINESFYDRIMANTKEKDPFIRGEIKWLQDRL